ncbi:hypothetical protein B484DRAFT_401784 [Ochromonadaceae sp. CCMP2298]|nr:hypothetical protein B484DRAFT_401784 [Ochromonadaceae sp. CCMP2298]
MASPRLGSVLFTDLFADGREALLSCFLGLHDLVRLDSAYCNRDLRPRLLAFLRSPGVMIVGEVTVDLTTERGRLLQSWLLARGLLAQHVVIVSPASSDAESFPLNTAQLMSLRYNAHGRLPVVVPLLRSSSPACPSLRSLRILCGDFDEHSLVEILNGSPALQKLNVRVCSFRHFGISGMLQANSDTARMGTALMRSILRAGPTALTELRVDDINALSLGLAMTDVDVEALTSRCRNLTTLSIRDAVLVTDIGIAAAEDSLMCAPVRSRRNARSCDMYLFDSALF